MGGTIAGTDWTHHKLVKAVAGALRHRCGVTPGKPARIIVAVSGGADSTALLRAMALLSRRRTWRLELAVGHVQHHLRPETESEGDAAFVAELARTLDLPLLRADLDGASLRSEGNVEAAARRARYQALSVMAQSFDASSVAVAHHADDQLETVLMRLLRGASARGLAGMAWRRRLRADGPAGAAATLIRPMLGIDRQTVAEFLKLISQTWREDATNAAGDRTRSRLRRDVLPVLRQLTPDAARRSVRLGEHLRQVNHVVNGMVEQAADRVARAGDTLIVDRVDARGLPVVVLGGLLRRLLRESGADGDALGRRALDPIMRAVRDHHGGVRRFRLDGVELTLDRSTLTLRGRA